MTTTSSALRITISTREAFADGAKFGTVGAYETLHGVCQYALDPRHDGLEKIVDIETMPRNDSGQLEFSAPFCILKPRILANGNGRILYEANNRGNKHALRFFNDAPIDPIGIFVNNPRSTIDAGNGFLMRRGYTVVWSGWQGDILRGDDRMPLHLPEPSGFDAELAGPVRSEIIVERPGVSVMPLSGNEYTHSFEAVNLDVTRATLTARENGSDQRCVLPKGEWAFARMDASGALIPSRTHCWVKNGFKPGWLYEVIYLARRPRVMGLGFIAVRDLVSFLVHDDCDRDGNRNPLREQRTCVTRAYGFGFSQTARFFREFVYRGFNTDADGRKVFSGVLAHVAGAGRITLNYRYAQPGRHPRQHQDRLYATDEFPFSYAPVCDAFSGRTDGILRRPGADPVIVHTQGSAEYWERRGSLAHTDTRGRDLADHERSRVYLFGSAPHDPAPYVDPNEIPLAYPKNMLRTTALLRALLVALDEWASNDTAPPPSAVPRIDDGTGVSGTIASNGFPKLRDVHPPAEMNRLFHTDFGDGFDRGLFLREPPFEDTVREYPLIVPQVDADGLDVAGIRTPDVAVPLATYVGWNLRESSTDMPGVMGSMFPMALTEHARAQAADPRPSIEARFATKRAYVEAVRRAAEALRARRLLLVEDVERYVIAAENAPIGLM